MAESFKFQECVALIKMTGRRAADTVELLEAIKEISPESIFHHMHQYFLKSPIVPPEFPNDFAVWLSRDLGELTLAEGIANLNPFEFDSIEAIRAELIRIIENHIREYPVHRPVLPGKEFFFNEGVTLIVPSPFEASNLEEFLPAIGRVDASSIYFHFYEARLRLGKGVDDFCMFFSQTLGKDALVANIKLMDPYMYSTEVLRKKITLLVQKELGG